MINNFFHKQIENSPIPSIYSFYINLSINYVAIVVIYNYIVKVKQVYVDNLENPISFAKLWSHILLYTLSRNIFTHFIKQTTHPPSHSLSYTIMKLIVWMTGIKIYTFSHVYIYMCIQFIHARIHSFNGVNFLSHDRFQFVHIRGQMALTLPPTFNVVFRDAFLHACALNVTSLKQELVRKRALLDPLFLETI